VDRRAPHPRLAWATLALGLCAAALAWAGGETEAEAPVELGAIRWSRDFDAAQARAKKEGKPLLVLFQEVPG
jgi:hypothetical protein